MRDRDDEKTEPELVVPKPDLPKPREEPRGRRGLVPRTITRFFALMLIAGGALAALKLFNVKYADDVAHTIRESLAAMRNWFIGGGQQ